MQRSGIRQFVRQVILSRRLPQLRTLLQKLWPHSAGHELIRFGPSGDGGYLLPDDLQGLVACFSPGVCETSGFELDCTRLEIPVYMADASVEGPAEKSPLFQFTKKFIGAENGGDFITLQQWVKESIADRPGDLLLQMDIEGYEYDVLTSIEEQLLARFRIIIIEFHNLQTILNGRSAGWHRIRQSLERLTNTHVVVHAHPNNTGSVTSFGGLDIPDLMELTLLRRDRGQSWTRCDSFPHPLDCENDPTGPVVRLPRCWYGS